MTHYSNESLDFLHKQLELLAVEKNLLPYLQSGVDPLYILLVKSPPQILKKMLTY